MFRRAQLSLSILSISALLIGITAGRAFSLNSDQQKCVNGINKSGAKLASTQGKLNSGCVKTEVGGGGSTDTCVLADGKGKVAKAKIKVDDAFGKCTGLTPAFGKTTAATVKTAAVDEEINLLEDVFGSPADAAIAADNKCQTSVAGSYEKLASARTKDFNSCKKAGLKDVTINSAVQLVNKCMANGTGADLKGKVQGAHDKLEATITSKCASVNLATSFPGCSAEATNANVLEGCIGRKVECRMCLALSTMDGVDGKCDQQDDNILNATCRQCGNSVTEAPEACDDGGDSATCDFNCTTATCGDGYANAAAGEACDAGVQTAACDSDCTLPVCTDGHLNTLAGEVCDDGNNINGDGCDNNCKPTGCPNGIVTAPETCDDGNNTNGDGCDNNCKPTGCGNGIVTAGETCDDGNLVSGDGCDANCTPTGCGNNIVTAGEACDSGGVNTAGCDSNCTLPVCPDNIFNAPAGEACDDNNASNNDMCVGTCDLATCGDGFLCNTSCTTGPGGGNEQCDNGGANSNVTPNACRTNCRTAFCGDNVVDAGEFCDSGGVNTAGCDSNCTSAVCGDGFTNTAAGETCDGGGETVSCDANCTARVCGDGTINVTAGEDCDDGNAMSGDGCSSTCQNGAGSGEQDAQCPNLGELTLLAGTGQTCTTNGDCTSGSTCDTGIGHCVTATSLDTGFTGISHDADINDLVLTMGDLRCEGLASPTCGQCTVLGLNPDPGYCRCTNNNRTICDQPFVADNDDCGGAICDCYFGPPLPLSAGNTPACVTNRFFDNISGTANVDTGAGAITAHLRAKVFLGEQLHEPCPVCGGTCTAGLPGTTACSQDIDCDTSPGAADGVCGNYDPTPNDGNRGGKCYLGANAGLSCDNGAPNTSFPAPGSGGCHEQPRLLPNLGEERLGCGSGGQPDADHWQRFAVLGADLRRGHVPLRHVQQQQYDRLPHQRRLHRSRQLHRRRN
jgi:cysteine-rich repeat protein